MTLEQPTSTPHLRDNPPLCPICVKLRKYVNNSIFLFCRKIALSFSSPLSRGDRGVCLFPLRKGGEGGCFNSPPLFPHSGGFAEEKRRGRGGWSDKMDFIFHLPPRPAATPPKIGGEFKTKIQHTPAPLFLEGTFMGVTRGYAGNLSAGIRDCFTSFAMTSFYVGIWEQENLAIRSVI